MATVAARAPKRELAPDWRDALREAMRRFAVRTIGAVLFALAIAAGIALATHSPTDPSFNTAAAGTVPAARLVSALEGAQRVRVAERTF